MEMLNRIIIFVLLIALLITLYKHQQYVNNNGTLKYKNDEELSSKSRKNINNKKKHIESKHKRVIPTKSTALAQTTIEKPVKKTIKKQIQSEDIDSVDMDSHSVDDSITLTDNNNGYKKDLNIDNISNDSIGSNLSFIDDNFFFQK